MSLWIESCGVTTSRSNESYWAVPSTGTVYYAVQDYCMFWIFGCNPGVTMGRKTNKQSYPAVLLRLNCSVVILTWSNIRFSSLGATSEFPGKNDSSFGVNNTNSYLCPTGHYCEKGDLQPRPCQNGTYNDLLGAEHEGRCKPCDVNYFNNDIGKDKCKFCGDAKAKEIGSDTCSCTGLNRVFKVREKSVMTGHVLCWTTLNPVS